MVQTSVGGKRGSTSAKKAATPPSKKPATKTVGKKAAVAAQQAAIEQKLFDVLNSIRSLGPASYPTSAARLFQLAEERADVAALAKSKSFAKMALVWIPQVDSKTALDAPQERALVFQVEDRDTVLASDTLVSWAIASLRRPGTAVAFTLQELSKVLPAKANAGAFAKVLEERASGGRWPLGVGTLARHAAKKKETFVFLIEDILPSSSLRAKTASNALGAPIATPTSNAGERSSSGHFGRAFEDAFDKLDRAGGDNNQVLLRALREAFPHLSRSAFDAELASLRSARRFTLESHDGRHQRLAPEDLDAGIREESGLLVYAARRNS